MIPYFEAIREARYGALLRKRSAPSRQGKAPGHAVRGLTALEPGSEEQLKYLDFIDIYATFEDNARAEYQRDYPEEAATMSRFAERFYEQDMQQGMRQGCNRARP